MNAQTKINPIYINLDPSKVDEMMAKRDLTFDEVLERSDPFTPLTKLTFERARSGQRIMPGTLDKLCYAFDCQEFDLLQTTPTYIELSMSDLFSRELITGQFLIQPTKDYSYVTVNNLSDVHIQGPDRLQILGSKDPLDAATYATFYVQAKASELDLDDAERPVTQDYELLPEPCIYIDASVESKIQNKQIIDLARLVAPTLADSILKTQTKKPEARLALSKLLSKLGRQSEFAVLKAAFLSAGISLMRVTVGYHHFTTIESGGKKLSPLCRDLILIVPSSENELFVKYQTRLAVEKNALPRSPSYNDYDSDIPF